MTSTDSSGDNNNNNGMPLSVEEKVELINRNLDEVIGADELRKVIAERDLKVYWGTAPTGKPHIGYFVPMSKIADFLRAGCEVKILFADLHAFLDNQKAPIEVVEHRTKYYEFTIKSMLRAIGVPLDKLIFVGGRSYQLGPDYTLDVYRLASIVTERNAKKAGAEVVKQVQSPLLSGLLYPLLQALDEEYLGVDAQFGGVDQRKIFVMAQDFLPKLGYKKRIHLMNPMVPGLQGTKMSSSEVSSKIDLLDTPEAVRGKIRGAFCAPGSVEANGVLAFIKMVLFAVSTEPLVVPRSEEHGGDVSYDSYEALEADYVAEKLWPNDIKNAVEVQLNKLLDPIRKDFEQCPEWKEALESGYSESSEAPSAAPGSTDGDGNQKKSKGDKKQKKKSKGAPSLILDASALNMKAGRIMAIDAHPDESATHLYVVQVDIGDSEGPRQCVMGVADKIPAAELENKLVAVCCNLKPSRFRGVDSHAMVLGAYDEASGAVEIVEPHPDTKVGTHLNFENIDRQDPMPQLRPKKKEFDVIAEKMSTNDDCEVTYDGAALLSPEGPCTVKTLKSAKVK